MLDISQAKRIEKGNGYTKLYVFDCILCRSEFKTQSSYAGMHSGRCKACATNKTNPVVLFEKLTAEGYTSLLLTPEGRVTYVCPNGHSSRKPVTLISLRQGRRCIFCLRTGRTPRKPNVLAVGARSGDLEVKEYLGVVNGFSRVLARNVVTNIEKIVTTGDFKRQKHKLLDAESIRKVLSNNGKSRKGLPINRLPYNKATPVDGIVYGLYDANGELRYVGQTGVSLVSRLSQHLASNGLKKHTHKNHWLLSMLANGHKPVIASIQILSTLGDLNDAEDYWIKFFRNEGCRLTNGRDGGMGLRNPSPETRAKMSAAKKGKIPYIATIPKSNSHKESIRQSRLGTFATEDAKKNMSAAHKERWAKKRAGQEMLSKHQT